MNPTEDDRARGEISSWDSVVERVTRHSIISTLERDEDWVSTAESLHEEPVKENEEEEGALSNLSTSKSIRDYPVKDADEGVSSILSASRSLRKSSTPKPDSGVSSILSATRSIRNDAVVAKEDGVSAVANVPDQSDKEKEAATVAAPVDEDTEDESGYPHGFKLYIILLSLCLTIFLVALDQTIISTAIPKITDQFKSVEDIGWYGSSYLLTTTALQASYGSLYAIFDVGTFPAPLQSDGMLIPPDQIRLPCSNRHL